MRRVVLSTAALGDLTAIGDYIASDSPKRAQTFVDELIDCCETLADTADAFPALHRYRRDGVRRRSFQDYLILYRSRPDVVEVLRIVHGARDYEKLLLPKA